MAAVKSKPEPAAITCITPPTGCRRFGADRRRRMRWPLYSKQVKAALPHTTWVSGCKSWYFGKDGLPEVFPRVSERHTELLRDPVVGDFDIQPA